MNNNEFWGTLLLGIGVCWPFAFMVGYHCRKPRAPEIQKRDEDEFSRALRKRLEEPDDPNRYRGGGTWCS